MRLVPFQYYDCLFCLTPNTIESRIEYETHGLGGRHGVATLFGDANIGNAGRANQQSAAVPRLRGDLPRPYEITGWHVRTNLKPTSSSVEEWMHMTLVKIDVGMDHGRAAWSPIIELLAAKPLGIQVPDGKPFTATVSGDPHLAMAMFRDCLEDFHPKMWLHVDGVRQMED